MAKNQIRIFFFFLILQKNQKSALRFRGKKLQGLCALSALLTTLVQVTPGVTLSNITPFNIF